MGDREVALTGGKLNRVVRVGETVRRPAGPWTPTVHALLRHIRAEGFDLAPEPHGFDDNGREVLSYIPGETVGDRLPWPRWVWDDRRLVEVGKAVAFYHRAVACFRPPGEIPWQFGARKLGPGEIVCHHDIAPYNVVVAGGRLRGIIDWDLIGPGTARSDLAFVAWQWVPLQHPGVAAFFGWHAPDDLGRRLRLLLDSYGLDHRDGFVDDLIVRVKLNRDGMLRKAAEGEAGYVRLVEEGHVRGMEAAIAFIETQREGLETAIK